MIHDLIIIGSGPAGMSAAIYAKQAKLDFLIIGSEEGSILAKAPSVENYLGFEKLSGFDLIAHMKKHISSLGIIPLETEAVKIVKDKDQFLVMTKDNRKFYSKKVLLSTGLQRRKLNLPNEKKFLGRGISYCSLCDGPFYKGKTVAVIGNNDDAINSALYLSRIASSVYLISTGQDMSHPKDLLTKLQGKKIKVMFNKKIIDLKGDKRIRSIEFEDKTSLEIDGLFIELGYVPQLSILKDLNLRLDKIGFIKIDQKQKTNIDGLFAAGDLTTNPLKQVVSAAYQGAFAVFEIIKELNK